MEVATRKHHDLAFDHVSLSKILKYNQSQHLRLGSKAKHIPLTQRWKGGDLITCTLELKLGCCLFKVQKTNDFAYRR